MKLTFLILIIFCSGIFAQGNFTTEWESPVCYSVGYTQAETSNSIFDIILYQMPFVKVLDGATKSLKYQYSNPDTSSFNWNYEVYNRQQIDVNQDGVVEIISIKQLWSPNYTFTAKILNGQTGAVLYTAAGTGVLYNTINDIDGDGYLEIIWITSSSSSGQSTMKIISTTATPISVEPNSKISAEYKLGQNYPNPFNPATTIEYSVSKEAEVSMNIFNEIGQLVKNITEGNKKAGDYKIQLDCSDMASGVYFYQLVVDGIPEAKKMVLVK